MIGEDILCDLELPGEEEGDGIEPAGSMAVPGAVQLANAKKAKATPTLAELFPGALERMRARGRGDERMLPVPWDGLARLYRGEHRKGLEVLRPGVHVLVGGTGSGKTQLALSIALEAARAGAPVTYVGLELDEVGIIARLMGIESARGKTLANAGERWAERWSSLDWPEGSVSREALERVAESFSATMAGPIGKMRLKVGGGRAGFDAEAFGDLLEEAKRGATAEHPALVVLDFLQLLGENPAKRDDGEIRTRIARASYLANNATLDGRVAVLLVSATPREKYETLDNVKLSKLPPVGNLVGSGKESGEIEYSATSVLVMARPDSEQDGAWPELGTRGWGAVRLIALAKGRHGGSGWAVLGWDGGAFYDIDPDGKLLEKETAKKPAKAESGGGGSNGGGSKLHEGAKPPRKR